MAVSEVNSKFSQIIGRATKMRFSKIEVPAEADSITENNSFSLLSVLFLARGPKKM